MKTYQIKRLIAVAAIACLPIACGTSSPTGADVAALEANSMSALRAEPLPPQVPEDSPESIPVPVPSPKPEDGNSVPSGPQPDSGVDTTPHDAPGTTPADDNGPGMTPPAPPTAPEPPAPSSVPPPPPVVECLAVSIEIGTLSTFTGTNGVALEAILLDEDGLAITDSSCEKVLWTVEGSQSGTRVEITYGASSRFVTVTGPAGTYKVGAATPNDQSTVLVVTLQ